MHKDFEKLRSLYMKYDSLISSGEDVVSDLRREINNHELSYLRDAIIPKVAMLLGRETRELRCEIDCSLQASNGKVEYSFCTDNSPMVRDVISKIEPLDLEEFSSNQHAYPDLLDKISSTMERLSVLSAEIDNCRTVLINCINQLKEVPIKLSDPPERKIKVSGETAELGKEVDKTEKILFCRSLVCNAKGKLLPNRNIIILKGSILRTDVTPTYGPKAFRAQLLDRYCTLTKAGYVALQDLPEMSVSGASGLCLGRSSNGNVDWKDEYGNKLADL